MFADAMKKEEIFALKKKYNEENTCNSLNQEFVERMYVKGCFLDGNLL